LRVLGGGLRIGIASGEFSGVTDGLGLFVDHWFDSSPKCSWGNLSSCRRCGALDPRRGMVCFFGVWS
jgi:hypothetical protein